MKTCRYNFLYGRKAHVAIIHVYGKIVAFSCVQKDAKKALELLRGMEETNQISKQVIGSYCHVMSHDSLLY